MNKPKTTKTATKTSKSKNNVVFTEEDEAVHFWHKTYEGTIKKKSTSESKSNDDLISYKGSKYKKSDCVTIYNSYVPKTYCVETRDGRFILKENAYAIITNINKDDHEDVKIEYSEHHINKEYSLSHRNIYNRSLDYDQKLKSKLSAIYNTGIRDIYFNDINVLTDAGYVEDFISGYFMFESHKSELDKDSKRVFSDFQKFQNPISYMQELSKTDLIEYGIESPTFIKTEGKKYTYGIEIETIRGIVPTYVRGKYNMCAKFDGSLRLEDGNAHGAEYITGVLKGDAGLIHIYKIMNELSKRCAINKLCSVHVHVGSVDFNQEYIVYMYKLGMYIEQELFNMMPISRSKSEYCQKMKKIDFELRNNSNHEIDVKNAFEEIRRIINVVGTDKDYKISKKHDHPMGHCCGYKRDTPRYWWLNFVPAMYNIRGNESYTMEFRLHSSTLNYKKVENWILICLGIVNFVENHKRKIVPGITLRQIMTTVYPKNGERLADYIDKRKSIFSTGNDAEVMEYSAEQNMSEKSLKTKKQILTS